MIKKIKVFKVGGSVLNSVQDIADMISCLSPKIKLGKTVIVHGGGNAISLLLGKLGIEPRFIEGQRVTDEQTMQVVEMVLSGTVNKELVAVLSVNGYLAAGISGRDANLALAKAKNIELGRVGEVEKVNPDLIFRLLKDKIVPVISPVCSDSQGFPLNVNADFFAADIAVALEAEEFDIVTVTGGVFKEEKLVKNITCDDIPAMIKDKTAYAGMIPKLEAALKARKGGVARVKLINYKGKTGTCVL